MLSIEKKCSSCKEVKDLSLFYKKKSSKDGFAYNCKECSSRLAKQWCLDNPERKKALDRSWAEANTDKVRERSRRRRLENPEYHLQHSRNWKENHPEEHAAYCKSWNESHPIERKISSDKYHAIHKDALVLKRWIRYWEEPEKYREISRLSARKNPERSKAYNKQWNLDHPEYRGKWHKNRMKNDIGYRLRCNLRGRLYVVICKKQKRGSAVRDLGCNSEVLISHLTSLFEDGMTWENYGNGHTSWNVDHIMPLTAFNLEDRQHFLLANHYLNLRPMWQPENASKGNKIPYELLEAA